MFEPVNFSTRFPVRCVAPPSRIKARKGKVYIVNEYGLNNSIRVYVNGRNIWYPKKYFKPIGTPPAPPVIIGEEQKWHKWAKPPKYDMDTTLSFKTFLEQDLNEGLINWLKKKLFVHKTSVPFSFQRKLGNGYSYESDEEKDRKWYDLTKSNYATNFTIELRTAMELMGMENIKVNVVMNQWQTTVDKFIISNNLMDIEIGGGTNSVAIVKWKSDNDSTVLHIKNSEKIAAWAFLADLLEDPKERKEAKESIRMVYDYDLYKKSYDTWSHLRYDKPKQKEVLPWEDETKNHTVYEPQRVAQWADEPQRAMTPREKWERATYEYYDTRISGAERTDPPPSLADFQRDFDVESYYQQRQQEERRQGDLDSR